MKKNVIIKTLVLTLLISLIAIQADTLDYPHTGANNIGCDSCHFIYGGEPSLLPPWTSHIPQDIDDTQYNILCWSCHNGLDAPYVRAHSTLTTDNSYGDWTVECRTCHNPHYQKQFRTYGGPSYLYQGTVLSVTATTLTKTGAGWTPDEYQGLIVVPNIAKVSYNYQITGNTSDTLTVKGTINMARVSAGNTFAIIYGKLVQSTIKLEDITTYIGVSTDIPDTDTIVEAGAGWTDNQYQNLEVMPSTSYTTYTYTILSNTSDTLTVQGPMNLSYVDIGDIFKIVALKTGDRAAKYFRTTGTNSFADGVGEYDGICEVCHTQTNHFRNDGEGPDPTHTNMGAVVGIDCTICHQHVNGFTGMGDGAHPTHVTDENGPKLVCADCHGLNVPPALEDGQDLANTVVCDNCHSAAGAVTAKNYWHDDPDTWVTAQSESGFCGSCHDVTPGNTKVDGTGDTTVNIMGDNSTYGYFVTGHGKTSGNYPLLSWQAASSTGNPAADRPCNSCHDLTVTHYNSGTKRLKAGYENDVNNSNCKQCHSPGTVALGAPDWYTTYADYQNSAHSSKKCSDCHDVHGASGAYAGMAIKNQESLCYDCHTDGVVQNLAVSGSAYADDIQDAFSMTGSKHDLGTSFSINSENYTLECISCHNVHIVTGKYWDADQNKSPVTLFSNNTSVWGDDVNEKIDFYAVSAANPGKYTKPGGSTHVFDGDELPDYPTFCLECHQYDIGSISWKDWEGNPHGRKRAGYSGLGINYSTAWGPYECPSGYNICGRASGWSGSTVSDESAAWPVIPKGRGYVAYVKGGYDQAERNAGLNYTLSCTDCHEAHGSDKYSLMRRSLNAKDGTEYVLSSDKYDKHGLWQGGNPEGVCWSCHGGYQLTKEHFQWHMQKGYCSA